MRRPLRVLCVEDSEDDWRLLSSALCEDGYDLTASVRVETAVALKEALTQHTFDVVISDYLMPCSSGLEALSVVKETGLDIPFILVSGQVGEEVAVAAMRAGAHDYVMKDNLARLPLAIERELNEAALRQAHRMLREVFESRADQHRMILDTVGDNILMLSPEGIIVYANPAVFKTLGYTPECLIGMPIEQIVHPSRASQSFPAEESLRARLLQGDKRVVSHERFQTREGMGVSISYVSTPIRERSEIFGVVIVFKDMTDSTLQKATMVTMEYRAMHDPLTQLPNRALLRDRLECALLSAQRDHKRVALMLLDVDRFKEVNDHFGHLVGDLLLREVGVRLRSAVRNIDTAARIGGDEFALLLQTDGDAQSITAITSKVLDVLRQPCRIEGHTLNISASLGIALFPDHGRNADVILEHADMAMFSAKRRKSGYALYDPGHDMLYAMRTTRVEELEQAIDGDDLSLHYQPKVFMKTGHVTGSEALVRWQHPSQGLILPDQFIPLAEQSSLVVPITRWVIKTALAQYDIWRQTDVAFPISINVSGLDLRETALSHYIEECLQARNLSPDCLVVEIVESAILLDGVHSMSNLWHLKQLGVRLSIDDFGVGYSSLSYLKKLPVDEVKIDRSFVSNITLDGANAAIVSAVIDMAHNLGLSVVAEGVEDQATWNCLRDMGCDAAQGYYIHRPTTASEMTSWMAKVPRGSIQ